MHLRDQLALVRVGARELGLEIRERPLGARQLLREGLVGRAALLGLARVGILDHGRLDAPRALGEAQRANGLISVLELGAQHHL